MAQEPLLRHKFFRANLVLLGVVAALFFLNFYQRTIFSRPASYHQWRQADCLSITKNYYEEGMRFFHPVIHYQGVEGGKAVGECPILNYTAAVLWKIFGEHEFLYRLLNYLIFLLAVFVLFNTLLKYTRDFWLSLLPSGIMLTSPLLVFYGLNFLADVPGLSLAVISFCLLFHFVRGGRERFFYASLTIGTIAVLIKASALIPLCMVFLTALTTLAGGKLKIASRPFARKLPVIVGLGISAAAVITWYRYAIYYNDFDKNNVFLLTVLPMWMMEQPEILHKLKLLFNVQFPLLLNKPMFFFLFLCAAFVIARFRALDALLRWSFAVSGIYFLAYIIFFFWVFDVHDYYLINIFIFPVITFFSTMMLLARTESFSVNVIFARIFVTSALIFNGFHSAAIYRLRMVENDAMLVWFPFISKEEMDFARYLFWEKSQDVKKLEHFTPVLREHGITRTDRVLSIPDHSFNVTLYLMDQKGYTVARDHLINDTTVMDRFMKKVDYIVLSDTSLSGEVAFRRMQHNFSHYFTQGPVKVFKLKHAL